MASTRGHPSQSVKVEYAVAVYVAVYSCVYAKGKADIREKQSFQISPTVE